MWICGETELPLRATASHPILLYKNQVQGSCWSPSPPVPAACVLMLYSILFFYLPPPFSHAHSHTNATYCLFVSPLLFSSPSPPRNITKPVQTHQKLQLGTCYLLHHSLLLQIQGMATQQLCWEGGKQHVRGAQITTHLPSLALPSVAVQAPPLTSLFGAPPPPPPLPPQAAGSESNPVSHVQPLGGNFQFPPFGQKTPPSSDTKSQALLEGEGKPATPLLFGVGASSSPSSATSGFVNFGTDSSAGAESKLFKFPLPAEPETSPPTSGFKPSPSFGASAPVFGCSTGATTGSAPAFGCSTWATSGSTQTCRCSTGAATSPAFGCSGTSNSLFTTPTLATAPFCFSMNGPVVPSRFSSSINGCSQEQWAVRSCPAPWANPLHLNVKGCYCGKVAGIRFSNKTDGTLGLFYCCPDYNEEAIRNGTQDRNYCTYKEWSNNFSMVRRCLCGKVAVLQKSERFNTRDMLFYSCPEYKEKDVMTGRCNRDHCSYLEWYNPPVSF